MTGRNGKMERKMIDPEIPITDVGAWTGLYMDDDGWVVACHDTCSYCDEDEINYPGYLGSVYIRIWESYEDWKNEECDIDGSEKIYYEYEKFSDVIEFISEVHAIDLVYKIHDYTDPDEA